MHQHGRGVSASALKYLLTSLYFVYCNKHFCWGDWHPFLAQAGLTCANKRSHVAKVLHVLSLHLGKPQTNTKIPTLSVMHWNIDTSVGWPTSTELTEQLTGVTKVTARPDLPSTCAQRFYKARTPQSQLWKTWRGLSFFVPFFLTKEMLKVFVGRIVLTH